MHALARLRARHAQSHRPMRERLQLRVRYDRSRLAPAPAEVAPVLLVWSSIRGARHVRAYPLRFADPSTPLSEPLDISVPLPAIEHREADDAVWFEAQAHTPNEHGRYVLAQVGQATLPLELLQPVQYTKPFELELAYYNYADGGTDQRRVKGAIFVEKRAPTPTRLLSDEQRAEAREPTNPFRMLMATQPFIANTMNEDIRRGIWPFTDEAAAVGQSLPMRDERNARVHAPAWNTPAGFVAGAAYFVSPRQQSSPPYSDKLAQHFNAIADAVLARHNRSREWMQHTLERQLIRTDDTYDDNFTTCVEAIGQMVCAVANSLPYIGDAINTAHRMPLAVDGTVLRGTNTGQHGVESFDAALERGGGDCEDLARLIHAYIDTLRDCDWPRAKQPLLHAIGRTLRNYTALGALSSVAGAQLSDESKHKGEPLVIDGSRDKRIKIGAHMYEHAMPTHKFAALIERVSPDFCGDTLLRSDASRAPWRQRLPHLVLEGTGRLNPLQRPALAYINAKEPAARSRARERAQRRRDIEAYLSSEAVFHAPGGQRVPLLAIVQHERQQDAIERTPNTRVNKFYRTVTGFFTGDCLKAGYQVAYVLPVNLGDRDVESGASDFSDDPLLETSAPIDSSLALPIMPGGSTAAAAPSHAKREPLSSMFSWNEPAVAAPAVNNDKRGHPHQHKSALQRVQLLACAAARSDDAVRRRIDRFDEQTGAKRGQLTVGVELADLLRDRPLPDHVALAAGPLMLDEVSARVTALVLRHSKPVPLGGDLSTAKRIHAAARESLMAAGVDLEKLERVEQQRLGALVASIEQELLVDQKYADTADPIVFTLFMPTAQLRVAGCAEVVYKMLADAVADGDNSHIRGLRTTIEDFTPGHRTLAMHLYCDAN